MARYKMSIRDQEIYDWIVKSHPAPLSSEELVKLTGKSYQSTYRGIQRLAANKKIMRKPYNGNSYAYCLPPTKEAKGFPTYEKGTRNTLPEPIGKPTRVSEIKKLSPGALLTQLNGFNKEGGWNPKFDRSAHDFMVALVKLYEDAWDAVTGSVVQDSDLTERRLYIMEFRQDLIAAISILDKILATPDIWNSKKFADFLFSGKDPEEYMQIISEIKERNGL